MIADQKKKERQAKQYTVRNFELYKTRKNTLNLNLRKLQKSVLHMQQKGSTYISTANLK